MVPKCKVQVTKMEKNDHIMGRSFLREPNIIIKTQKRVQPKMPFGA